MTQRSDRTANIRVWADGVLNAAPVDANDERALTLAQFIQGDVQAVDATAQDWLDRLATVEGGGMKDDEGTGNTFTVLIDQAGVTLQNAIFPDDPMQRYTHTEFRRALQQVLIALKDPSRETQPSIV